MADIVNLNAYRSKSIEKKGFGPWQERFDEVYGEKSRLSDLSDKTLYYIAQPGEDSAIAYYELIMGILDLGKAPKFAYLDKPDQMAVVDIHLIDASTGSVILRRSRPIAKAIFPI